MESGKPTSHTFAIVKSDIPYPVSHTVKSNHDVDLINSLNYFVFIILRDGWVGFLSNRYTPNSWNKNIQLMSKEGIHSLGCQNIGKNYTYMCVCMYIFNDFENWISLFYQTVNMIDNNWNMTVLGIFKKSPRVILDYGTLYKENRTKYTNGSRYKSTYDPQ